MQLNIICTILGLYFTSVSAIVSNSTVSIKALNADNSAYTPQVTTLEPSFYLEPSTYTTISYVDDTTTLMVTSIMYATVWYTPISTVSTQLANGNVNSDTFSSSADTITTTSTRTTVVYVTLDSSALSSIDIDAKMANSNANADGSVSTAASCVPTTEFVTIMATASPVIQYVTVTPEPIIETMAVFNNATTSANSIVSKGSILVSF